MIIQWDESISVHNQALDSQHREFIEAINRLDELSSGKGDITRELIRAVEFLEEYSKKHFMYEESYMINHNYPELEIHKEEHNKFIRTVESMKSELKMDGATAKLVNDISRFVADWLMMHIRGVDHRYVVFIETGKIPAHTHKKFG
jgi:hemerythrin